MANYGENSQSKIELNSNLELHLNLQSCDVANCKTAQASDGHEEPKVAVRQFRVIDNFAELVVDQDERQEQERRVEIVVVGQQPDLLAHHRQHLLRLDRVHGQRQ